MVRYVGPTPADELEDALTSIALEMQRRIDRLRTVVEIYVAMPPALEWNGLSVLTAAGLEAGLIKMIQPPSNRMGVQAASEP